MWHSLSYSQGHTLPGHVTAHPSLTRGASRHLQDRMNIYDTADYYLETRDVKEARVNAAPGEDTST